MKILHIIPSLKGGGAERVVLDIYDGLSKRAGMDVKIISFSPQTDFPERTKNIQWEVIPANVQLSITGKKQLDIAALQKAIDTYRPDVIHSHLFAAEIVSRHCSFPSAKWFSHAHGFIPEFLPLNHSHLFSKKKLAIYYDGMTLLNLYKKQRNNRYIAISKPIQAFIQNRFSGPCYYLPNGIRYDFFHKPNTAGPMDVLKLITVGRLDENKSQLFLVDVVAELRKQRIAVELAIVGSGYMENQIRSRIKELGLDAYIQLYGQVDAIEDIYPHHHLYLHAAKKEAMGLTLLEAMCAGLPVISTNGGGNAELIEEGKNGYLIHVPSVQHFTEKIKEIKNNQTLYEEMSRFSVEFAKKYNLETYIDRLLEIYTNG